MNAPFRSIGPHPSERTPVNGATLDAIAAMFDRLGPEVTIGRQPAPSGRGKLWTVHTSCPGAIGIGQGATLGEALRDLHAIGSIG